MPYRFKHRTSMSTQIRDFHSRPKTTSPGADFDSMTRDELRAASRARGMSASGDKAALLKRLKGESK